MPISLSVSETSLQVAAVSTAILFTKVFCANAYLGWIKFQTGTRPAEDGKAYGNVIGNGAEVQGKTNKSQLGEADQDSLSRAERIVGNDLENIPLGLILIWAALICNDSEELFQGTTIAFVLGRVGHSISYGCALSYLRTTFYVIGLIATFINCGILIQASFR